MECLQGSESFGCENGGQLNFEVLRGSAGVLDIKAGRL